MKKLLSIVKPFEELKQLNKLTILIGWLIVLFTCWIISGLEGSTHLFPTLPQVLNGFHDLWFQGLIPHIGSSLALFFQSVLYSILISLTFCYLSPLPLLKPIATFVSKLRYLPLTGISFYLSILISDARHLQVGVLVIFMSTFLITSLLGMINEIPQEEFDHARTLGCNRWEILWELIVKGRIDYVFELIRQNLAIVWMSLVSIESILVAAGGLGFLIKNSDKLGSSGKVIALQIVIVLIGLLLDYLLTKGRKILFRYSKF